MTRLSVREALEKNDLQWKEGAQYPKWVDLSETELDQFYTSEYSARKCLQDLAEFLCQQGIKQEDCLFVEPSAGSGAFSKLLPSDSTIAMDIAPSGNDIQKQDFLTWDPAIDPKYEAARQGNRTIIAIGNPPFGRRGWFALSFLNKCATFADYCAFLLPMSFAREGKGSPKYRVDGMYNISSHELLKEQFQLPDGKTRKLNVVWQIWGKGENKRPTFDEVDKRFTIKCIGDFSYRLCGQKFKEDADVFISQGYFPGTPMNISTCWNDILYGSGYGIQVIDGDPKELVDMLDNIDWRRYSKASTHGCRHIGITEIKQAIQDAMFSKTVQQANSST